MKIQLTQQIIINKNHKYYDSLDYLCYLSKNLYNTALYTIKNEYNTNNKYLNYFDLNRIFKETDNVDYRALPYVQCSQQILRQMDATYKAFFRALRSDKMKGKKIKTPHYKEKKNGRNIVIYTNQTIKLKENKILLKGVNNEWFEFITDKTNIQQVRITPKGNHITLEIIYSKECILKDDNKRYGAIDLGINNFATLTSNVSQSVIYNGRPLKAINTYYNKKRGLLQSKLKNRHTSKRIKRITYRRNNKIKNLLHVISASIINYLLSNELNTLIVGKNIGWKESIQLGHATNQNFVSIPHSVFIDMLYYKCVLNGIHFIVVNEAYTSKCSFIDNEPIGKHDTYKGKRIKRGLFKTQNGTLINADINGSFNIMRLGLKQTNVKLDVSNLIPENKRFMYNPLSVIITG